MAKRGVDMTPPAGLESVHAWRRRPLHTQPRGQRGENQTPPRRLVDDDQWRRRRSGQGLPSFDDLAELLHRTSVVGVAVAGTTAEGSFNNGAIA